MYLETAGGSRPDISDAQGSALDCLPACGSFAANDPTDGQTAFDLQTRPRRRGDFMVSAHCRAHVFGHLVRISFMDGSTGVEIAVDDDPAGTFLRRLHQFFRKPRRDATSPATQGHNGGAK